MAILKVAEVMIHEEDKSRVLVTAVPVDGWSRNEYVIAALTVLKTWLDRTGGALADVEDDIPDIMRAMIESPEAFENLKRN